MHWKILALVTFILAGFGDFYESFASPTERPAIRHNVKLKLPRAGKVSLTQLEIAAAKPAGKLRKVGIRVRNKAQLPYGVTVVSGTVKKHQTRKAKRARMVVSLAVINRKTGKPATSSPTNLRLALATAVPVTVTAVSSHIASGQAATPPVCKLVSPISLNFDSRANLSFNDIPVIGKLPTGFSGSEVGAIVTQDVCGNVTPVSYKAMLKNTNPVPAQVTKASKPTTPTNPQATDAVILVSGFTTQTPYTTPSQTCSGSQPRGAYWSLFGDQLEDDNFNIYTAPVNLGSSPIAPPNCPPAQPVRRTVNSISGLGVNGAALANYIAYLHDTFGVKTVRLVGHSDGGIWVRSAMDWHQAFPDVQVLSIATIASPHTGAFPADIIEGLLTVKCKQFDCSLIQAVLKVLAKKLAPGKALPELTAQFMKQWNKRQVGVIGNIPVTALSGDAISFAGVKNRYISPNDVLVGINSAQAAGLDRSGVLPNLRCTIPRPDVHSTSEKPLDPSAQVLLEDEGLLAQLIPTLSDVRPQQTCPTG